MLYYRGVVFVVLGIFRFSSCVILWSHLDEGIKGVFAFGLFLPCALFVALMEFSRCYFPSRYAR